MHLLLKLCTILGSLVLLFGLTSGYTDLYILYNKNFSRHENLITKNGGQIILFLSALAFVFITGFLKICTVFLTISVPTPEIQSRQRVGQKGQILKAVSALDKLLPRECRGCIKLTISQVSASTIAYTIVNAYIYPFLFLSVKEPRALWDIVERLEPPSPNKNLHPMALPLSCNASKCTLHCYSEISTKYVLLIKWNLI